MPFAPEEKPTSPEYRTAALFMGCDPVELVKRAKYKPQSPILVIESRVW